MRLYLFHTSYIITRRTFSWTVYLCYVMFYFVNQKKISSESIFFGLLFIYYTLVYFALYLCGMRWKIIFWIFNIFTFCTHYCLKHELSTGGWSCKGFTKGRYAFVKSQRVMSWVDKVRLGLVLRLNEFLCH